MGAPPLVDIMMLTYNRLAYTQRTLESLWANTDWPYRLRVIDNASQDGTREYLQQQVAAGHIHHLYLQPQNTGNATGKNLALQRAETGYVCLLDNDMLLLPGWLRQCMEAMLCFRKQRLVLMSPWPIWQFDPSVKIGELRDGAHHVFLTRKLSGQVWIGVRRVLLECGGFQAPADGRLMGFFASPLSREVVRRGYRIGCVAGAALAVSMDREGSAHRLYSAEYEAYREWNRLQKSEHQVLPDFYRWRTQRSG